MENMNQNNKPEYKNMSWEDREASTELSRMKRRRSLDRYLEGWTVRDVLTPDGGIKKERIYVADYYTAKETKKQNALRKLVYFLLFAASVAVFAIGAIQPVPANTIGLVGMTQGIVLLAMIWVSHSLFTYVTAPHKMTVGDYKTGVLALRKSCFWMALAPLLTAVATLVHLFLDPSMWARELLCILCYLACGAIILLVHLAEKRLGYDKTPSTEAQWADVDAD